MTAILSLTDFQQRIGEIFDTQDVDRIKHFEEELQDYGVESEEQLDDSYYGCYPNESDFCEDLIDDCYSHVMKELPVFMQTAIDYELIWHQSMQYDFFTIYDRDSHEYYFFNRNF